MGEVYRASCPKCGYEKEFYLGSGLMSIKPYHALKALEGKERTYLETLQENGAIDRMMAENLLVKSCACKGEKPELMQKTLVTATDKIGRQRVFGGNCKDCGKELVRYEGVGTNKAEIVMCPQCAMSSLTFTRTGHWD